MKAFKALLAVVVFIGAFTVTTVVTDVICRLNGYYQECSYE